MMLTIYRLMCWHGKGLVNSAHQRSNCGLPYLAVRFKQKNLSQYIVQKIKPTNIITIHVLFKTSKGCLLQAAFLQAWPQHHLTRIRGKKMSSTLAALIFKVTLMRRAKILHHIKGKIKNPSQQSGTQHIIEWLQYNFKVFILPDTEAAKF